MAFESRSTWICHFTSCEIRPCFRIDTYHSLWSVHCRWRISCTEQFFTVSRPWEDHRLSLVNTTLLPRTMLSRLHFRTLTTLYTIEHVPSLTACQLVRFEICGQNSIGASSLLWPEATFESHNSERAIALMRTAVHVAVLVPRRAGPIERSSAPPNANECRFKSFKVDHLDNYTLIIIVHTNGAWRFRHRESNI